MARYEIAFSAQLVPGAELALVQGFLHALANRALGGRAMVVAVKLLQPVTTGLQRLCAGAALHQLVL